jgi:hypothetical protein
MQRWLAKIVDNHRLFRLQAYPVEMAEKQAAAVIGLANCYLLLAQAHECYGRLVAFGEMRVVVSTSAAQSSARSASPARSPRRTRRWRAPVRCHRGR